ncbi:MAG: hypothetical protein D6696_15475 [Acidobacteria bacterium]|nr:MAG: hypothetical protein D6696_15475 [Acidobacteriota bacterium]
MLPLLLAAGLGLAPPAAAVPAAADPPSELAAVCERLRAGDNPFFGQRPIAELEAMLARHRDDDPRAIPILGRLGLHQLILGRLEEARATFERARALAARPGIRAELRARLAHDAGLVRLQQAEDRNCLALHAAASCILPITAGGVHREPDLARQAGDLFAEALRLEPATARRRWLLNLARMLSGDYPQGVPPADRLPPRALEPAVPFPRLVDVAPQLGVNALDLSGGAVMDDFDGDGLLDLVSSTWDPCDHLKAFRNDGRGGFEDVTRAWGLDRQLGGLNLVHADFDGDGALDLLVLRGAWLGAEGRIRNSLLRNDLRRSGRFADVTAAAGLATPAYPTQAAAWADYDLDGDLDLYVGNEGSAAGVNLGLAAAGDGDYPANLFRNNGDGTFTDVARQAGVANERFAKGVAWGDYDNDGDPDLYVSNSGPNRLYRNDGPGAGGTVTFTDVAAAAGVQEPLGLSFACWFFDVDEDGDLDLFVADYGASLETVIASYFGGLAAGGHPRLYRNDGPGAGGDVRFTDVSAAWGLDRPLLPMGANFGDLDGDGWLDVYLGTGLPDFDALVPNVFYRNDGGRRFLDATFAAGLGHLQKGHGIAFGDLDNDGDLDLFQQMGGAYPYDAYTNVLYENPGGGNRFLILRLLGRGANPFAAGARLALTVRSGDARRTIHRLAGTGGSFGGSSWQQEIGLGRCDAIERLDVRWPGGGVQTFRQLQPDRAYRLVEGSPRAEPLHLVPIRLGRRPAAPHPQPRR